MKIKSSFGRKLRMMVRGIVLSLTLLSTGRLFDYLKVKKERGVGWLNVKSKRG